MGTNIKVDALTKKLYNIHQRYSTLGTLPLVYMMTLIIGLSREEAIRSVIALAPLLVGAFGMVGPYLGYKSVVKSALAVHPGEPADARLIRILKIPGKLEMMILSFSAVAIAIFVGLPALYYGKSLWSVPWSVIMVTLLIMLVMIQERVAYQRALLPYAIEEFHRSPSAVLRGSGLFWQRQRWYLPYTFAVFVMCTLFITSTIMGRQAYEIYVELMAETAGKAGVEISTLLGTAVTKLIRSTVLPLILLGTYLLVVAALSAWRLAQVQTDGAKSVQVAMEALASGAPKLPEWVSTDEVGDLAVATARVFEQLKNLSLSLGSSAQALKNSAEELGLSTTKQTEVLTLQATALQETQVTAQEIKQTSSLASQKAEGILAQAERADEISHSGEAAVQRTLAGLQEIGEQVREMAKRIKALDDRTRQIANITTTVKDLADQSNMLALNAAIEAVRSGEHGKGFGVVAREIRALADQSIQATNSVREILQDIGTAISTTVSITEKGSDKVEASLVQIREFGNNIRQLSGIVRENAASVRQITAAVTQQNAGIGQIFQAVNDLSKIMDQTMSQLRASDKALALVRNVVEKVGGFVGTYAWEHDADRPADAGALNKPNPV